MKKKILLLGIGSLLSVCSAVAQNTVGTTMPEMNTTSQSYSLAASMSELLATLRQKEMLRTDGTFVFKDDDATVSGQLLCDDSTITEKVGALENVFKTPNFDIETTRRDLNTLLKCISLSDFENTSDVTAKLNGGFSYPAFNDGSALNINFDGLAVQANYGLNGRQQTVKVNATTDGKTIGNFESAYDVDAVSPIFELGMLAGISSYAFADAQTEEKIQQEAMGLFLPAWKSSRISKAEIYRPTGEPLFLYNKALNDHYTVDVFSSENKKIAALNWNGQVLNIKFDFPKSNMTLFETKLTFPADFGEKYEQYLEKLYSSKANSAQSEMMQEGAKLISGVQNEGIIYGLNGKPLAKLNVKTKDNLDLNEAMATGTPMDLLDSFEVKNLGESGCSIKTISFTQVKPNILTICRTNGCQDESFETMASMPEIMGCFGEIPVMFQRFQNELEQEVETLSKAFMGGALGGMAMKRYVANEIVNSAAQVGVIAMAKNAGQGGDADLSELGGVSRLDDETQKVILTDNSIRADQNGQITIEMEPTAAKDIMPIISELFGDKVVSGCTSDTNICVIKY